MGFLIFMPFVSGFLLMILILFIIYLILRFIFYIFQSFGLLKIAREEDYKHPYIVWIPCVSHYVLGKYCGLNKTKSMIYCILTFFCIISLFVFWTTSDDVLYYISTIYNIIYFIIDMFVMNIFYQKEYKNYQLFTILTILTLGLLKPVFIYTSKIKIMTKMS